YYHTEKRFYWYFYNISH
ncbi:GM12911, partial [Drosophila sechellia]